MVWSPKTKAKRNLLNDFIWQKSTFTIPVYIIFSFLKCVFCYFWISIAKCAVFFQELRSAIVCWRVRTPTLEIFWSSFSLKAATAAAAMLMLGRSESTLLFESTSNQKFKIFILPKNPMDGAISKRETHFGISWSFLIYYGTLTKEKENQSTYLYFKTLSHVGKICNTHHSDIWYQF